MTTLAAILFWLCVGLIVYAHVGYPLVLFWRARGAARDARARRELEPAGRADPQPPAVALIIPAYDEEEVIARKVANALALDYPRERLQIDRRLRRLHRPHRRARPRGRRRPRPGAAAAAARSPP